MKVRKPLWLICLISCLLWVTGCRDEGNETAVTPVLPTPTQAVVPTPIGAPITGDPDFIVVATDAPN